MNHLHLFENFPDPSLHELYTGVKGSAHQTKRVRKLKAARQMLDRGVPAEQVRQQTGWFKGKYDEEWRFEITDAALGFRALCYNDKFDREGVRFKSSGETTTLTTPLVNLLSKTTLLREYPQLRGLPVHISSEKNENHGYYHAGERALYLFHIDLSAYPALVAQMRQEPDSPATQQAKTAPLFAFSWREENLLLHELQHAIQHIEGFYGGSTPEHFAEREEHAGVVEVRRTIFAAHPDLEAAWNKVRQWQARGGEGFGYRQALTRFEELDQRYGLTAAVDAHNQQQDAHGVAKRKVPTQVQYQQTAGEIEARDVQSRRALNNQRGAYALLDLMGKVRYASDEEEDVATAQAEFVARKYPGAAEWTIVTGHKSQYATPYDPAGIEPHRAIYPKNGKIG